MNIKQKDALQILINYANDDWGEKKSYLLDVEDNNGEPIKNHIYFEAIKPLEDYLKYSNRNTDKTIMDWM